MSDTRPAGEGVLGWAHTVIPRFSALDPNPVPPQELLGSETVNPFKGAREMEGIGEIQLLGHLLHHQPAIEQEFRRAVEPEPEKKLIGGGVRETPEKAAEIRQLHMTGGGHRLHRFDLNIVFLHPLLGALVSRKGARRTRAPRHGAFRDFRQEYRQQLRA